MKNRFLKMAFVCFSAMFVMACQKQSPAPQPVVEPTTQAPETPSLNQRPEPASTVNGCYSRRYKYCWELVSCNCTILKEIVIVPHFTDDMRIASGSDNPLVVAGIFNNASYKTITSLFPGDQLDSLRSGHYNLSIQYEDATKICIFAGPRKPLTESNMAFAFQYDK